MLKHCTNIDFILYLDVSPEKCLERIKERGREFESSISLNYLKKLDTYYTNFINNVNIPVLKIDYNDFIDVDKVVSKVLSFYKEISEKK
jgi:deoxyadenosine kinase